ncbi:MAG: nitrate/nitrite two-component system sensor histidine kinase, partial [Betaproteobacteria bacterium HGW-Betaproteobacteria-21]
MKNRLIAALARRSILLLVGLAMVMMTLIGLGGMSASVVVAETVQGSASAINVAGSLRRLTHRIASVVV